METNTFKNGAWDWYRITVTSAKDIKELPDMSGTPKSWFETLKTNKNGNLEMETGEKGKEAMWGSILYKQDLQDQNKQEVLQYYLTQNILITSRINVDYLYRLDEEELLQKMEGASNAIEGFMILLGEIIASFLQDIDAFENRMHKLLWRLKEKNNENVLEQLILNRHEILVWKNLIIPIIEIREAVLEAFDDAVAHGPHYKRTCRRINRCREIIREYDEEIREMTDLETVISSHRGNEIVKTLTVITMLFTPIAAWGALWGMNFEIMPELKWQYGYLGALLVIFVSTWGLYYYLKKKSWIGSVLKSEDNKKF